MPHFVKIFILISLSILISSCAHYKKEPWDSKFTIAVIPDTQNMVDYKQQIDKGFPVDGAAMFLEQMQYVADNTVARGGEVIFVTSLGDVWQHRQFGIDPDHYERGLRPINQNRKARPDLEDGIKNFEMPLAKRGYDILAQTGVAFSVVPGNHDYDWFWRDSEFKIDRSRFDELRDETGKIVRYDPKILGMTHVGGLDNFNSVFSQDSPYFKDKNWYISSFNDGANSAQIFEAGGYKFLHLGFEMQAGDGVLNWAQSVIDANPGLPTIMSTHDFLSSEGERQVRSIADFARIDPRYHNGPEEIWQKFISKNDQIFMVLSGHNHAQATRNDKNDAGHDVHQLLSDYQDRGQSADHAKPRKSPFLIGDGWLRLMEFDMSSKIPTVTIKTYSTYYKVFSHEHADYANWYKKSEHAEMTDQDYNATDHFIISLSDFKERFGQPQ